MAEIPKQPDPTKFSADLDKAVEEALGAGSIAASSPEAQPVAVSQDDEELKTPPFLQHRPEGALSQPSGVKPKAKPVFFADVKGKGEESQFSWDKSKVEPKPAEVASAAATLAPDRQQHSFHQGDEFAATSKDWKEKGDFVKISNKKRWMETSEADLDLNAQLAEMKREVDEFGKNYSKVAGEAGAKQSIIKKLNPFSNPEDYAEVKQALAEWQEKRGEFARSFYHDLSMKLAKGEIDEKTTEQLEHNFDTLFTKEAIGAHGQKFDFKKDYSEGRGWISSKVASGYNNFIGRFRKMHPALRIGLGAGIFVLGNIPATMAWRALGGLAAGKGSQEGLQAVAEIWRQRKERKDLKKFEKDLNRRNLSVQERINLRLGRIERQNQNMEGRMTKYARGDYYRKFAGVLIAGLVGSGTVARLIQGTGLSGVIREKIFRGGAAVTQAHETLVSQAPEIKGGGAPKLSPDDYARIQKTMSSYGPNAKMDEIVSGEAAKMYSSPNMELHHPVGASTAHELSASEMRAPNVVEPKIAGIKMQEVVASGKFGSGGSIERASNDVLRAIKADPAHYHLDPHSVNFSEQANAMREKMIEEFYQSKGFKSYADFDAYVRHHIQPGDQFKFEYDSATGKFHMDVESKAFGGNVSHGGAGSAQEIASNKPSTSSAGEHLAPEEDVKPIGPRLDDGHLHQTDYQPTRGGQMRAPQELTPQQRMAQIAQADQELAARHPEEFAANASETAKINIRIHNNIRGSWENIFQGAGFSKHGNVWNRSALEIFNQLKQYIPHDVTSPDPTNENMARLGGLFRIFGTPPGGMLMDEYLRSIDSNPANLEWLNTLKSAPIEELTRPLRK
jgi:hypothetical protein